MGDGSNNVTSLSRNHQPETDVVFFAMPFGVKRLDGADGPECDFDNVYDILSRALIDAQLKPERLDGLYGPTAMIELIWKSIQRAEYVVVDFTTRNHNVSFEFGLALVLGKKIIMIAQDLSHVPSDYRGHRVLEYNLLYGPIQLLKTSLVEQITALRNVASQEKDLVRLWPTRENVSAPATVIRVDKEYVVVRPDDPTRPPAVLGNADVDVTRMIVDMNRRFTVGDRVDGAFVLDPRKGTATYTLVPDRDDPWPSLATRFPVGTVFTSVVNRVISNVGPFVAVADEVNGLVPARTIKGPVPSVGTPVEVCVTKLDTASRLITLRLIGVSSGDTAHLTLVAPTVTVGQRGYGRVVATVPQAKGRGGFILLVIEGRERAAMLHFSDMSDELRQDLAGDDVAVNDEIYVEVKQVDAHSDRVLLRELPEPDEESSAGEGAAAA